MKKYIVKIIFFLLSIPLTFFLLDTLYPLDTKRIYKPKSTLIYDRNHQLLRVHLSEDGHLRFDMKSSEITEDIKKAIFAYEDQYFYYHFGVNPLSLLRALWFNLRNKRVIGASTLTMQVARMMHHKPRTIPNKLIEIFMALQLEYHYSKEQILQIYLNNTPYGGNIEGFASAAFAYFNQPVSSLSIAQIAYLVSIPKNPNQNRPKESNRVEKLKKRVLSRMFSSGFLRAELYKRATEEYISPKRRELPHAIPHLSSKIKGEGSIITTIDITLQSKIEEIIKQGAKRLNPLQIYNAAAIVIDNKKMEIVAYVGSQEFADKKHTGEVDGIQALFSPGSTLKPFVYAKALEAGIITPLKKLYDISLYIEGYKPLNYSEQFLGEVTAREALQLSLNIPAVELDRLLGEDSLYSVLKKAQIASINRQKSYYGSSLTLGGCGITLQNLAELFASFANNGVYQKANYLWDSNKTRGIQLLSKESAYLISQILVDVPRQSLSSSWEYLADIPKVAFKTGTSANARDMLSVGYTPEYTVAVWYGNFDGKMGKSKTAEGGKEHRLTGLEASSPTLMDIFTLLQPKEWFVKPKTVVKRKICQDPIEIGECREQVWDDVIEGVELSTPCSLLRAEILSNLFESGRISTIEDLSAHSCYDSWRAYKPLITSPIDGEKISQNRLLPEEYKKTKLQCYAFENNSTIIWLIDDKAPFYGISGKASYHYLSPDIHQIRCLDQGAKMREISVELEEL